MSEEEKSPTTGIEDTSPENGMGGISEEPPKKKRGRPPKQPGDPPGRYVKKDEKIVKKEQPMQKAKGHISYDPDMTYDEVVARDIDRHHEIMTLPRVNLNDLTEVQGRYTEFLTICRKYGKRLTVAGFAEALGISVQKLWQIRNGILKKPPEVVDFLNAVISSITAELEDLMVSSKINPVAGIFLLKQTGYKDNVDLNINATATVEKTEEELAAEYLNSIPTVED